MGETDILNRNGADQISILLSFIVGFEVDNFFFFTFGAFFTLDLKNSINTTSINNLIANLK